MVNPQKNDPIHPIHVDSDLVPEQRAGVDSRALRPGFEQLRGIVEDVTATLRRRKLAFLGVSGAVATLLVLAILLQTPLYRSTSLMLLKFGRELVYQPEIGVEQTFAERDRQTVLNSELAILRSQPVLEGAVSDVGIETLYPDLAEDIAEARAEATEGDALVSESMLLAMAAERLRESFSALALPETDVLQTSYDHSDPLVAQQTVNALVRRFTIAHLSAYSQPEIVKFLAGRVETYEHELAESEAALRKFQLDHNAFSLETPQTILLERRKALLAQLEELDRQGTTIRMSHLQDDLSVSQARSRLLALEEEVAQLQGSAERDTRIRINVVKGFIGKRKAEVDRELETLAGKRATIEAELGEIETALAELSALGADYRRLVRERDADAEQFRTYQRKLRDARLSSEMDSERIASINVIQPASVSANPVWPPDKKISFAIALCLAVLAGGLAAMTLDRIGPVGIAWLDGVPEGETRA